MSTEARIATLRMSLLGLGALAIAPIVIPIEYDFAKSKYNPLRGPLEGVGAALAGSSRTGSGGSTSDIDAAIAASRDLQRQYGPYNKAGEAERQAAGKLMQQFPGIPADQWAAIWRIGAEEAARTAPGAGQGRGAFRTGRGTGGTPNTGPPAPAAAGSSSTTSTGSTAPAISEATRIALALARNPNDRAAIEAKLSYDAQAAAFAERLINSGRLTKKQLDDRVRQLEAIYGDEASLRSQLKAMDAAAAATKKKADKQAQTFDLPLSLQLEAAKAGASGKQAQITAAEEDERRWVLAKIHAGKLSVQAEIAAYNELATLNSDLATKTKTLTGSYHFASLASLTRGITDPNVRKAVEARIAQAQAHSGHTPSGTPATYITVNGGVHAHGVQDPQQLVDAISEHGMRGTASRRGANAGHYLGRH